MGKRLTGLAVVAVIIGVVPALTTSDDRRLSVRLWLVVAVIWLAWSLVSALLRHVPPVPASTAIRPPSWFRLARRGKADTGPDSRPLSLRSLQGNLLSARDNNRAYALRLRPRLRALTEHQLALRHGIDLEAEPARAEAILGPLAWLVTDRGESRRPTLDEIDQLLTILDIASPDATETASP